MGLSTQDDKEPNVVATSVRWIQWAHTAELVEIGTIFQIYNWNFELSAEL